MKILQPALASVALWARCDAPWFSDMNARPIPSNAARARIHVVDDQPCRRQNAVNATYDNCGARKRHFIDWHEIPVQ
jgi:hypothetical protein